MEGSGHAGGIVAEVHTQRSGNHHVARIWIKDPACRTDKGIGVGSPVSELRSAYRIAWAGFGEGRFLMRVAELDASFELDLAGDHRATLEGITAPDKVPGARPAVAYGHAIHPGPVGRRAPPRR